MKKARMKKVEQRKKGQGGEGPKSPQTPPKKNGKKKKSELHQSKQYEEQSIFFGSPVLIMIMCPLTIITLWIFCTQPVDTSIFSITKVSHCISTWNEGGSAELQQ